MQGQRSAIGSLPESLAFEHGSASSDADQQICWNSNMRNAPSNRLSDCISPSNTADMYRNSANQENENVSMWSVGEANSSSVSGQVNHSRIEPKSEHEWPSLTKICPEPPASMLSLGDVNMSVTRNHANNGHHGPLFVQSSRPESVPHNVTVNPSSFIGFKSSNSSETHLGSSATSSLSHPFGPSSDPFEMEGRQLPCKRKAVELSVGNSSSGVGSSNPSQGPEGSANVWRENTITANATPSDQIIPRLGSSVGDVSSDNPIVGNNHRNVRLRINATSQQDPLPANNTNGPLNHSSPYPPLLVNPVDLTSPPENSSGQPTLRLPALRRNLQISSRWNRSSSSRATRSSNIVIAGENPRTMPTNISDHPIFIQPGEMRNVAQNAGNWSLNGVASSSRASSSLVPVPSSATPPSLAPHRSSPHHPSRRLSEFLRRSLLSMDSEGQNSNVFSRIPPAMSSSASSSQDTGFPPVVGIQGHLPHSRSSVLLDRQLEGAFGFPYLSRTVAAGSEGRGRLVSEIRNVLDLIRRGEGLRFEDVMVLDQSVFYGMADIHDRHRDMRLDIDNMSYEELLALEERIGNVNTGLTEETISNRLKLIKYACVANEPDAEPCCICQEEYVNGDDLGALECGHDFHTNCIKQWLLQKNLCPVCKSMAFATK